MGRLGVRPDLDIWSRPANGHTGCRRAGGDRREGTGVRWSTEPRDLVQGMNNAGRSAPT
jgi:hypothetical protein